MYIGHCVMVLCFAFDGPEKGLCTADGPVKGSVAYGLEKVF